MTDQDYSEEDLEWDYSYDYYSDDFTENTVAQSIYVYTPPLLLLFGTFGNVFSLLVMVHLSQQVFSTCIYLAILAIVDMLVLYTRCGNDWLQNMLHIDLSNQLMVSSESICKVFPFVFNFIFHLSKWLLLSVAIEGFISTRYPEKVTDMCTLSRAKAVILFLTVVLICVNIHYFWSFELVEFHSDIYYCTFAKHGHQHSEEFQEVIWPIMDLLVAEVIPYCTVITCCILMLIRLLKGDHRGNKSHQQWRKRYQMNPDAMDQLKVTILVICALSILLTLPKFTFSIFRYIVRSYELIEHSFKFEAQQSLAHAICATLEYFFLSLKFFVYFATSHQFRVEYFKLLRGWFCRCRRCFSCHSSSNSIMLHHDHTTSAERTTLFQDKDDTTGCLPEAEIPSSYSNHQVSKIITTV